jgi:HSP20 family protein
LNKTKGENTMTLYIQPYPYRRAARQVRQAQYPSLNVNVTEQDDAYVLSALVPGLKADDLNIQVLENVVSIEGEYPAYETEYLLNELPSGSFSRVLRMPTDIQADKVEAKITDGVLTLTLPKVESARPKRINISVN